MCKICSEWELGKLTNTEAMQNLGEVLGNQDENLSDPEITHYYEVLEKIIDKDAELSQTN